eukprot:253205_1
MVHVSNRRSYLTLPLAIHNRRPRQDDISEKAVSNIINVIVIYVLNYDNLFGLQLSQLLILWDINIKHEICFDNLIDDMYVIMSIYLTVLHAMKNMLGIIIQK